MSDDAPQNPAPNGAQSLSALLGKIADRLDAIETRMALVEAAKASPGLNVPQLVAQGVAGAIAIAVVVGAILGKVDLATAIAFAGGLGFSLPGLLQKGAK